MLKIHQRLKPFEKPTINFDIHVEVDTKVVVSDFKNIINNEKHTIGYRQYVVAANGFVIAHFLDETSLASYMEYLKKFGFERFPKDILEILRQQALTGAVKRIG